MSMLHRGYSSIVTIIPPDLAPAGSATLLKQERKLRQEIRNFRKTMGEETWLRYLQPLPTTLAGSRVTICGDFPIVEYPIHLQKHLDAVGFAAFFPQLGLSLSLY